MKYYVTGTLDESVQTILEGGGAKKTAYLSGINTHCIVGSDPDYNEVISLIAFSFFVHFCFKEVLIETPIVLSIRIYLHPKGVLIRNYWHRWGC